MTDAEREAAIHDLKLEISRLYAEGRKEQAIVCFYTMSALLAQKNHENEGEHEE